MALRKKIKIMTLRKKLLMAAVTVGAVVLVTGTTVYAVSNTDTGDGFSNPSGTVETGSLTGTNTLTFAGTIDGTPITVTCTAFNASGKIPSPNDTLTIKLSAPPTLTLPRQPRRDRHGQLHRQLEAQGEGRYRYRRQLGAQYGRQAEAQDPAGRLHVLIEFGQRLRDHGGAERTGQRDRLVQRLEL